jgi:DNA-binding transcriptional ArsR family regulator
MELKNHLQTEPGIKKLSKVMRLLGHPLRIKAIFLLTENEELSAGDLCRLLRSEQTLVSHHLGDLRKAGVLSTRRAGKSIIYSLHRKKLPEAIFDFIASAELDSNILTNS